MTWPHYNQDQLVDDVIALLAEKGITTVPDPAQAARREQGAAQLLSGLCVIPTRAPEKVLDLDGQARYNRLVHGD
ncbi:hypothetical protein [Pseudonocardia acaciae]|uniref:hypothetical protein n=1 Tax=Pseudonocardia acaciae TaxID=551276 RepID=UPI00048C3637|nr:hypothetical protein [Pseudonocardia acaciae]